MSNEIEKALKRLTSLQEKAERVLSKTPKPDVAMLREDIETIRKALEAQQARQSVDAAFEAVIFEVRDAMKLLDKKGMAYWILEQALKGQDYDQNHASE